MRLLPVFGDAVDCLPTPPVRLLPVFGDAVDCLSTPPVRLLPVFGNAVDSLLSTGLGAAPCRANKTRLRFVVSSFPAVNLRVGRSLPGKQDNPRICRLVDSPLSTRLWAASYRGNEKSLQICRLVDSAVGPVKSQPGMQVCSCRPASSRLGK